MMTREEALRRFKAARQTKMNAVAALEEKVKQAYEERTGMKANYVVTAFLNAGSLRMSARHNILL